MSALTDTSYCYVGIEVDGEEVQPHTQIVSVPFAHYAQSGGGWEVDAATDAVHAVDDTCRVGIWNDDPSEPLSIGDDLGIHSGHFISVGNAASYSGVIFGKSVLDYGWVFWDSYLDQLRISTVETGLDYAGLSMQQGHVGVGLSGEVPTEALVVGKNLGSFGGNRVVIGGSGAGVEHGLVVGEDNSNCGWLLWNADGNKFHMGTREEGTTYGSTLTLQGGHVGINIDPHDYAQLTVDRTFNTTSTRYGVVTHARNSSPAQIFGTWSKGELTNWTDGEEWVYGVYGVGSINGSSGGLGGPSIVGVRGYASGGHTAYGVYGEASGAFGNYAGYFHNGIVKMTGDLVVDGTVYKGGGSFRIDHPLDPENKYLQHSFVESPDMMNIYNGNVALDDNGEATVQMPEWFEPLNRDFRYQLTCIGGFAPVYIADKLADGRFRIAGGTPGLEVSWQVTGIRQDRWANDNRIQVEVEKTGRERGLYVHPDAYGLDEKRGISSLHVQPAPATAGE